MRRRLVVAAVVAAMAVTWSAGVSAAGQQADGGGKAASSEHFDKAKVYFERARKLGFPAASSHEPYVLRGEFTTRGSSGEVQNGSYTDTWVSDKQWRREAVFGKSRFVRSRDGKRFYRVAEGPDAELLQFVLTVMEPIPTTSHLVESNWKIKRDVVDGVAMVRVAAGHENADGTPDPKDFDAFWFDESGQLMRTNRNLLQSQRSNFEDYNGVRVARRVEVLLQGKVGMRINVTELGAARDVDRSIFKLKGQDWTERETDEVR